MYQLLGRQLPMGPREGIRDRIRSGREFLVSITGRDFGYDALRWHEYLWDTDAGGYRWSRRSREKWARLAVTAMDDTGWRQAVQELESEA
jgi:hypothetical protein